MSSRRRIRVQRTWRRGLRAKSREGGGCRALVTVAEEVKLGQLLVNPRAPALRVSRTEAVRIFGFLGLLCERLCGNRRIAAQIHEPSHRPSGSDEWNRLGRHRMADHDQIVAGEVRDGVAYDAELPPVRASASPNTTPRAGSRAPKRTSTSRAPADHVVRGVLAEFATFPGCRRVAWWRRRTP